MRKKLSQFLCAFSVLFAAYLDAQPQLMLCADQNGRQVPCPLGQSANNEGAYSAATEATQGAAASIAIGVGPQIGRLLNAFDMEGQVKQDRARRYAPQTQPKALSSEEIQQQAFQKNREHQIKLSFEEEQKTKIYTTDFEHTFSNLDAAIESFKKSQDRQEIFKFKSQADSQVGRLIREYVKRESLRESLGRPRDPTFWKLLLEADESSSERLLKRAIKYYRYRLGGSHIEEYSHQKLPQRIQSEFGLGDIDASTFKGSEIIEVARELDQYPQVFENEWLKLHAALALKAAEEASLDQEPSRFFSSIDKAWAVVDYAKGILSGFKDFAYDTVESVGNLILHPIDSVQALYQALVDYDKTYDAIQSALENVWNDYDTYSSEEKGYLHAQIAAEVLSAVLPIGSLKHVGTVSKSLERVVADAKKLQRIGNYIPAPPKINAFPDIRRAPYKTPIQSGGGMRRRWKDSSGKIYEWDHRHGTVEIYNKRGKHLGEFDPESGQMLKEADPGRHVEP